MIHTAFSFIFFNLKGSNVMKRTLGFLLCVCLVVNLLPVFGVSVASPESDFTFDGARGTITKYIDSGGEVV